MPNKISVSWQGGSSVANSPPKKKAPIKTKAPSKTVSTAGAGDPHNIAPVKSDSTNKKKSSPGTKNFETFS